LLDDAPLELHGEDASAVRLPWKLAHEALPSCRRRIAPSVSSSIGEQINAFTHQIRTAGNDAGHPVSVDPVTPDEVHASLLIFPQLAALASQLKDWITSDYE
jgi:hypothetical protein